MFSKNIKSIFIIVTLIMISLGSVVLNAECDMMGMISKSNSLISNIEDPDSDTLNDFDDPVDFFDYIRERSTNSSAYINYVNSTKNNDDGYGFSYYKENDYNISNYYPDPWNPLNQAWYLHGESNVNYYGDNFNPIHAGYTNNIPLNITESMILNYINYSAYYTPPSYPLQDDDTNNATILLGHARQGTWGTGNHPFRFEHNNRTYIFMHNGGLDDNFIDALEAYLPSLENEQWFANHLPNWGQGSTPAINSLVDTELLFHYIMSFIIDNDDDVISGIYDALTQTDIEGCNIRDKIYSPEWISDLPGENGRDGYINVTNFVLSDGENLYVFRNSPSSDSWHELSYKDNDTFYSVKTLDPRGGNIMNKHDFVILSRDEEPIVYSNFLEMKIFSSGWQWLSFPRLTEQGTSNGEIFEQAYFENNLPGLLQETSGTLGTINGFVKILGHRDGADIKIEPEGYEYILNDEGFENMLFRHEGYKIEVDEGADPTVLIVNGNRLNSYVIEYMPDLENFWLGYYVPYSQNIKDAFGYGASNPEDDFWGDVNRVWAEDWYYDAHLIQRGEDPNQLSSNSTIGKTMEHGKMYIVQMYRDVYDFSWYGSTTAEEPEKKAEPENFTYTEKADYEVIDVINIPPNVTEIGVFEEDECVGAVVVKDSCAQILVYSDNANRDPIPFTFEIITGRGLSIPFKDYLVLNQMTCEFEPSVIISGRQGYSAIKFGDQEEPENIISRPILNGNYPNPFNPTTTISFSLPDEQDIELTIYNIKGQKVKTLYSGTADVGEHTVIWEGKDTNDKLVSSGIYFYKLKTNNEELTRKMLMMK